MGKLYEELTETLQRFISAQHVFFVATAPRSDTGHVNLSPKGLATFAILSPRLVAYVDYVGSGAETIAHLNENGRITILFCAFEGPPRILRLYGHGRVIEKRDPAFESIRTRVRSASTGIDTSEGGIADPVDRSVRAVIVIEVTRIADSCGFGVPLMTFTRNRTQLDDWVSRKTPEQILEYQREKNTRSIDGLPALRLPERE